MKLEPLSGAFFPFKATKVKRYALRALASALRPRRRIRALRQWLGV
jgi:hypothetical protein